jgi:hypothetical protein
MIPSQVTTTNLPITRFDIDFKKFYCRTVRFMVFTKTGNNFTLDYITDPYLAERDGLLQCCSNNSNCWQIHRFFNKWNN